jgi:hypothetical protein
MTQIPKILPLVNAPSPDDTIDLEMVRSLCSSGLVDCLPEDRAVAWLLLSRVFPPHPRRFRPTLESHLAMYTSFVRDFELADYHTRAPVGSEEHPLLGVPRENLMSFIHGDVNRTPHHTMLFPPSDVAPPGSEPRATVKTHLRRMERILYIFASVNPSVAYLQGFHELVCVLYYVFANAVAFFGDDMMQVEATVFYAFQQLMGSTRLQELFQTADNASLINHQLHAFMELVAVHVPEAAAKIAAFEIHPLTFAFKWLNLLFAQDHLLPNLVLIWDVLYTHFERLVTYAMYVGVAHIKMIKQQIVSDDCFTVLDALQRPQISNVAKMLKYAKKFWDEDGKKKRTKGKDWLDLARRTLRKGP